MARRSSGRKGGGNEEEPEWQQRASRGSKSCGGRCVETGGARGPVSVACVHQHAASARAGGLGRSGDAATELASLAAADAAAAGLVFHDKHPEAPQGSPRLFEALLVLLVLFRRRRGGANERTVATGR